MSKFRATVGLEKTYITHKTHVFATYWWATRAILVLQVFLAYTWWVTKVFILHYKKKKHSCAACQTQGGIFTVCQLCLYEQCTIFILGKKITTTAVWVEVFALMVTLSRILLARLAKKHDNEIFIPNILINVTFQDNLRCLFGFLKYKNQKQTSHEKKDPKSVSLSLYKLQQAATRWGFKKKKKTNFFFNVKMMSACLEFHPWEKIQPRWHWSQLVMLNCLPLFVFVHFQFELVRFDDAVLVAVLVVEHVLHHLVHAQARLDATFALCHLQLDELAKLSPTQHDT